MGCFSNSDTSWRHSIECTSFPASHTEILETQWMGWLLPCQRSSSEQGGCMAEPSHNSQSSLTASLCASIIWDSFRR